MNGNMMAKARFALVLFLISAIALLAAYAVSVPRNAGAANAAGGVLDLTGADFAHTLYPLNGEWEFYPEKLYAPGDFAGGQAGGGTIAVLPSGFQALGYPVPTYGTFRLTLKTGDARRLMVRIPEIAEAGVVWLNGEKVYEAGTPGGAGVFRLSIKNGFVSLGAENGVTEIVIQAASGAGIGMSGMTYSAWVGGELLLLGDAMFRRVMLAGVIGLMLMMALYHFVLFLGSPKDKIYLWYVLYVLVTALRMCMETNGLVQLFAPNGMDDWLSRAYLASFAVQALFIALFTFEAFRMAYWPRKAAWRAVYGLCGAAVALNVILYLANPNTPGWLTYICIIPFALLIAAAARRAFTGKLEGYMGLYLVALCLFFFWGIGTKLFADDAFYMPAVLSNVFMALTQAAALSEGYADARRKAKDLAAETAFYHRMSHDMLTPLTRVSTNVQMAAHAPETAAERLKEAQADVMRIADMVDKALAEGKGGDA